MGDVRICTPRDDRDWWGDPDEADAEPIMRRGLPRPLASCGLPQPYIAQVDDLKKVHEGRRDHCVRARWCQVCGLALGAESVVCARPGDTYVTDGAAIHPGDCWLLATTSCPELIDLLRAGRLLVWTIPTASLVAASMRSVGTISGAVASLMAGGDALFYEVPPLVPDAEG